jgi:hypothetical protein
VLDTDSLARVVDERVREQFDSRAWFVMLTDTILNVTIFAFIGFLIYLYLRDEAQTKEADRGKKDD